MADLGDVVDLFDLGVLHPVSLLEDRVDQHVDVLVDRPRRRGNPRARGSRRAGRCRRRPARFAVERGWRSCSSACSTSGSTPRRHGLRRATSTVRTIASSIVSVGASRAPRMRAHVEVDERVSPTTRAAPGVLDAAARRRGARQMIRDRVVDRRPSRRCRGCRRTRPARSSWRSTARQHAATQSARRGRTSPAAVAEHPQVVGSR